MNLPNNKSSPLQTIKTLVSERYSSAKAVFWAGSVSKGHGTQTSDLDLVIIFDNVEHAYREAFVYDDWPMDIFVHDPSTLDYFYNHMDLPSFVPALPNMIAYGILIEKDSEFGINLQKQAIALLENKPQLDSNALLNRRFHITDSLDDLKGSKNTRELMAIKYNIYQQLAEFYLLSNGNFIGSGKQLARQLEQLDSMIADDFYNVFSKDDVEAIVVFTKQILEPFGGLLWDGFRLEAQKEWRNEIIDSSGYLSILEELKEREPIFHHPDKFGRSEQDIIEQVCDDFWEVGASGNVYTRQYVIDVLNKRYADPDYKDIWETKDFALSEIAPDNYLLTYVLVQNKTRITRRSTIWRKVNSQWKILYHQGTIVGGGQ